MNFLLYISLGSLIIGIILFVYFQVQKKKLGSMGEKILYSDNDIHQAEILYATSLPLKGKPDAIIHSKEGILPLEIKTGKTPIHPRDHHVMQLMAYCLLVHEEYKKRPIGGILRYSESGKEFPIGYTKEAEESIREVVQDILKARKKGDSFTCNHPYHN